MRKSTKYLIWPVAALLIATLACQTLTGANNNATPNTSTQETPIEEQIPTEQPAGAPTLAAPEVTDTPTGDQATQQPLDAPFPLPPDVTTFETFGEQHINFQTSLNIEETIAFYRNVLGAQGLSEQSLLTVIDEKTFSMVFNGSPNGKALVIQGVQFTPESLNVNIRYEDL